MFSKQNKKGIGYLLVGLMILVLTGCKGAEDIQGKWYAVTPEGNKFIIHLTDKDIAFSSDEEKDWHVPYKQTGIGFKNNVSYRNIQVDNKSYSFVFPNKKEKENAVILVPDKSDEPTEGLI